MNPCNCKPGGTFIGCPVHGELLARDELIAERLQRLLKQTEAAIVMFRSGSIRESELPKFPTDSMIVGDFEIKERHQ